VLALDVLAFMFSCLLVFTGTCSSLRWFDVLGGGRLGWPNERPLHGNWSGVDRKGNGHCRRVYWFEVCLGSRGQLLQQWHQHGCV